MLVHIIADYGFGEFAKALSSAAHQVYLPDAKLILTPVLAFAQLLSLQASPK